MKLRIAFLAVVLAIGALPLPLAAQQASDGLARQLAGWYEPAAGPGNKLKIVIQPARPVAGQPSTYLLSVTIEGKYNGTNVNVEGALSVEPQGAGARLTWATRRSRDCQADIHPAGDGFEGVTVAGACQAAFQAPTPGRWEFQTEPGSFRVRSVETGETLRFRKVKPAAGSR